ncbi:MAG: MucB/RseB C-terminal domain-containing protein [Rhizobacter sp.]|nr:MucB/RseB C-terminal domain-containing protein [Rhizobacter sp.]
MRLAFGRMLFALVCAASHFTAVAGGTAAVTTAVAPVDPSEVRAWLMRIHKAASSRNYQGTFVVSAGGAVSSARIAHYCLGADQYESIETLDGKARNVLRHNKLVYTLWPQSRVALVEQRDLQTRFPALLQSGGDHIAEHYDVHADGVQRVAGRTANVLSISPKDDRRYAYRLWADQTSGLLLRAEVLDARGRVLESAAFSELAIGAKPQPQNVLAPMGQLEGYRVVRRKLTPADFEAEGWRLSKSVPGFAQVGCVRRPLSAPGDDAPDAPANVLQAVYSDGLASVSVFIEPYDAQRHGTSMQTSIGATQTMMRRDGDWWVTVVGDVPPATLHDFAAALTRIK